MVEALQSKQQHLGVVLARSARDELPEGPEAATDFHEVGNGFASVTPLSLDLTDFGFLEALEQGRPPWVAEHDERH